MEKGDDYMHTATIEYCSFNKDLC